MRTRKKKATDFEVGTIMDTGYADAKLSKVSEDDCFTKLYSPADIECSYCADVYVCGLLTRHRVKKIVSKKSEAKPFIDEADFSKVDAEILYKKIKACIDDGVAVTIDDLKHTVKEVSKVRDDKAIINYCKLFLKSYKLKEKEGEICQS